MKKYVLAQPGGFTCSINDNLLAIKKAGFEGVFFTLEYEGLEDEHIEFARKLGLDVETIHLPYSNRLVTDLWSEDKDAERCISKLKEGIDFAYRNQVKTVILHTVSGYNCPGPNECGLKNYRVIAEYCKEKGIILALENNKCLSHLEYLLDNLDDFDNVRLCFDIGHANTFTKNLRFEVWDKVLNKVHCLHIHDNDGTRDSHLIPYMGTIDIESWLQILKKKNPNLNLTLETYYMDRKEFYGEITIEEFYEKANSAADKLLRKDR